MPQSIFSAPVGLSSTRKRVALVAVDRTGLIGVQAREWCHTPTVSTIAVVPLNVTVQSFASS